MSRLTRLIRRIRQNKATVPTRSEGYFNDRLDGISDILNRSRNASVLDIGCNRGMVSFQFAQNGAAVVHGCDIYQPGIEFARELFAEQPAVSRFEVVDLTKGLEALESAFGRDYKEKYDIVLLLAVYHKLRRVMEPKALSELVAHLIGRAGRYFLFRGFVDDLAAIEPLLGAAGLRCVQYSEISAASGPVKAIYARSASIHLLSYPGVKTNDFCPLCAESVARARVTQVG